jgi:ribosome-associated translation inhibitor RaiA
MKIQFYKSKGGNEGEELVVNTTARLSRELSRFNEHITQVEVHLSEDNGTKAGVYDKRCVILVEVKDLHSISITGHAGSHQKAVEEAILKLKMSLYATYGRLRVY